MKIINWGSGGGNVLEALPIKFRSHQRHKMSAISIKPSKVYNGLLRHTSRLRPWICKKFRPKLYERRDVSAVTLD